jgi:hypothetical protein
VFMVTPISPVTALGLVCNTKPSASAVASAWPLAVTSAAMSVDLLTTDLRLRLLSASSNVTMDAAVQMAGRAPGLGLALVLPDVACSRRSASVATSTGCAAVRRDGPVAQCP